MTQYQRSFIFLAGVTVVIKIIIVIFGGLDGCRSCHIIPCSAAKMNASVARLY
jgi:hypothetical protein